MNERIKDFSKQSKEHAEALFPDHTKFNHGENWHEAYHNKFAELMVNECCEVAHCNYGLTLGTMLRKHFGVE